MNQIRFSSPPNNYGGNNEMDRENISYSKPKGNFFSYLIKIFGVLFILIVIISIASWGKNIVSNRMSISDTSFYAIFLSNGQVYFGKLAHKDNKEFIINNVYYLQSDNQSQGQMSEQKFTLIKLGKEIHGPTDEMYINRENILFYEQLRDDSEVVKSINSKSGNKSL